MPVVWIPSLLRSLTGGQDILHIPGTTVREVIDNLEAKYPGIKERLVEEGRLRPDISVIVDGRASLQRMRQQLDEDTEVHFLPAIRGG